MPNRKSNGAPRKAVSRQPPKQRQRQVARPRMRNPNAPMVGGPLKHYLTCRLDPFNSKGGVGIPDASSGRRIVVDHRQYYDVIVPSGGRVNLVMFPSPSTPLLAKDPVSNSTGGSITTGPISTQLNNLVSGTDGGYVGMPYAAYSSYVSSDLTNQTAHPYGANKFRIVSQAFKITYTGTTLNQAGVITINPNVGDINPPITNASKITPYNSVGNPETDYGAGSVLTDFITAPRINQVQPGSQVYRMGDIQILNKRVTAESEFIDIPERPVIYLAGSDNQTTTIWANPWIIQRHTWKAGMHRADHQFAMPFIYIDGMVAGTSFRVETLTCVEYMLKSDSTFAFMAKEAPSLSPTTLNVADKVISSAPLAAKPTKFRQMTSVALNSVGKFAGVLGGPAVGLAVDALGSALDAIL